MDFDQFHLHVFAQPRIEIGQRLVKEQDFRVRDDGARQRHPLLLAARELARPALGEGAELDGLQHLSDAFVLFLAGADAAHAQGEANILRDGQMRQQSIGLEHHGDVPVLRRQSGHVVAVDVDAAGRRALQAGDDAQQRRFAAARSAEQADEFARLDIERDAVQHGHLAERLSDRVEFYCRQGQVSAKFLMPSSRSMQKIRMTVMAIMIVETAATEGSGLNSSWP